MLDLSNSIFIASIVMELFKDIFNDSSPQKLKLKSGCVFTMINE